MALSYKIDTPDMMPLDACICLRDLERVARRKLTPRAAAYYYSTADSGKTYDINQRDWERIRFRPRVLRDVTKVSVHTEIMGADVSLPVFIAPAAAAGLGHPDGERCLARGAARMAIAQCVSSMASVPPRDIAATFWEDPQRRGGAIFFQLYIPRKKQDAVKRIDMAKKAGFQALVLTVDANVMGKRETDEQFKLLDAEKKKGKGKDRASKKERPLPPVPGQEPSTLRVFHNATLEWADLKWIRERWGPKPLIVKGIQSAEDAAEAVRHGADGIYLSNHGGRQLDYAPSAVQTLLEIRQYHPEVFSKAKVYVDGGVWRGADVVKALCLGASGVGIGRGFLFALSAYGTDGVIRAIEILNIEIQTTMRLLGVTDISQLNESFLNLSDFGVQAKL